MEILNRSELAETFGVSLTSIDNWVRRGCPYISRGGRGKKWEFDLDEVERWRDRENGGYDSEVKNAAENALAVYEMTLVSLFTVWFSKGMGIDITLEDICKKYTEWERPRELMELGEGFVRLMDKRR